MDWIKYRYVYFTFSALLIAVGIFSLIHWGLKLGVDFTGGTIAEYKFDKSISTEDATKKLEDNGFEVNAIQTTGQNQYIFRLSPVETDQKDKLKSALQEMVEGGNVDELRFETVGPSVGPELIKKTFYAIFIAGFAILTWVAYQFRSVKFGASAVLAMFHDTFNLIGLFALFGYLFNAEVDFLFVTAVLTTLSFSVHDTIVVYDRIRESEKKGSVSFTGGSRSSELKNLANQALTETMVRSLNNSFTIVFMLLALILLGGTTIRWFSVALFIGTLLGTYSSPFVAVPLLVTWSEVAEKIYIKRNKSK